MKNIVIVALLLVCSTGNAVLLELKDFEKVAVEHQGNQVGTITLEKESSYSKTLKVDIRHGNRDIKLEAVVCDDFEYSRVYNRSCPYWIQNLKFDLLNQSFETINKSGANIRVSWWTSRDDDSKAKEFLFKGSTAMYIQFSGIEPKPDDFKYNNVVIRKIP